MKTDYKEAQQKARELAKGRLLVEEEQEQTQGNRKARRGGINVMQHIKRQNLRASALARSRRERREKAKI